jgi:hypothetical protein
MCATWEAFSGANACLVIDPEDLGEAETRWPVGQAPIEHCAHICEWVRKDDRLTEDKRLKFQSDEEFFSLDEKDLKR